MTPQDVDGHKTDVVKRQHLVTVSTPLALTILLLPGARDEVIARGIPCHHNRNSAPPAGSSGKNASTLVNQDRYLTLISSCF